jgi:hypothetical protein
MLRQGKRPNEGLFAIENDVGIESDMNADTNGRLRKWTLKFEKPT